MSDEKVVQIKVHLSSSLKDKFAAKAKSQGISQAKIIRTLLHNFVTTKP